MNLKKFLFFSRLLLTFGEGGFGLAVEHDVDPGERHVSEESGHEAGEEGRGAFSLAHAAQSPHHTPVTVPATLKHKDTSFSSRT